MSQKGAFVTDVQEIRRRARASIDEGAVTENYGLDVDTAVKILNEGVATELVCTLRYKYHAAMAVGVASEGVRDEFLAHAKEEEEHMDLLVERICQLGGKPNLNPEGLLTRASSEYVEGDTLIDMIKENLVAERIAIEIYRDQIRFFGDKDPTTRILLEGILATEEEHANDMHDLLKRHSLEEGDKSNKPQGASKAGESGKIDGLDAPGPAVSTGNPDPNSSRGGSSNKKKG